MSQNGLDKYNCKCKSKYHNKNINVQIIPLFKEFVSSHQYVLILIIHSYFSAVKIELVRHTLFTHLQTALVENQTFNLK